MENSPTIVFNTYYTLMAAGVVLLLGRLLVAKIRFLRDFNIPVPVAGGLLVSLIMLLVHSQTGISIQINKPLQDGLMLMFFSSIGLSADFSRLKAGGVALVIFVVVVSVFVLIQDIVGVSMASIMGLDPLLGLVTGSITLTGGHGTALAWGQTLVKDHGLVGADTLGVACATFGLVLGGLVGGPVARRLLRKINRHTQSEEQLTKPSSEEVIFERPQQTRLITADSALETLTMFAACLAGAYALSYYMGTILTGSFKIPTFVYALAVGVVVRNTLSGVFKFEIFDRSIDVFGNVSLSLFLAMALMSLKLWELSGLAVPILVILTVQTIVMVLYAYWITFRVMGKDYDAAVLAAGHCGFGMGATPTAVANMQVITNRYGASHKAFLIVPMVGAFFVDLINAAVLLGFVVIFGA